MKPSRKTFSKPSNESFCRMLPQLACGQGGVVTLTSSVDSYAKKLEANDAAKNVAGVKAVAAAITIVFNGAGNHSDTLIATEVVNAFIFSWEVPDDKVLVTLSGEMERTYQKEAARKAVKNLAGVTG